MKTPLEAPDGPNNQRNVSAETHEARGQKAVLALLGNIESTLRALEEKRISGREAIIIVFDENQGLIAKAVAEAVRNESSSDEEAIPESGLLVSDSRIVNAVEKLIKAAAKNTEDKGHGRSGVNGSDGVYSAGYFGIPISEELRSQFE